MKVESIVAQNLYGAMQKAVAPTVEDGAVDFGAALESALADMRDSVRTGERAAMEALQGTGDVQDMVEALTATEMALETATTVRDRVVEAYQEIMRMPV